MNKQMEARIIVEKDGSYDEEDIDYIMETYNELMKHIGFEDNRSDKRYIVKFHDICYYTPDENEWDDNSFWNVFDMFCDDQAEMLEEDIKEEGIDTDIMLTRYNCGHYPAFVVDIPEIKEEDAIILAMKIYDEVGYRGEEYVKNYIYMVEALQNMEDYYMENWIEFLKCGEYLPEKYIKEIEDKYKDAKERRQAK